MQVSVSHFKEEQTTFASGPVHAVIAEQAITEPVLFFRRLLLHQGTHCIYCSIASTPTARLLNFMLVLLA